MKYIIELPDVIKDSAGVEYEPSGEWRGPNIGDYYLAGQAVYRSEVERLEPRIILRHKWTWPEWLGGWGFAAESSGRIRWYEREPQISIGICVYSGMVLGVAELTVFCPTFTPPLIADWRVPVLNPNYKAKQ